MLVNGANRSAVEGVTVPELRSAPEVVAESTAESDDDVQPRTMSSASPMNAPATITARVRFGVVLIDLTCNPFHYIDYGGQTGKF